MAATRTDFSTPFSSQTAATAAMRQAQSYQEQMTPKDASLTNPLSKQPFTKATVPFQTLMEAPLSKDDFYNTLQHSHLGRAYLAHFSENTLATVLKYTTLVGAAVLLDKYGWNRLGLHEVCFEGRRIEEHLKLGTEGLYTLPTATAHAIDQLTASGNVAAGFVENDENISPSLGFLRSHPQYHPLKPANYINEGDNQQRTAAAAEEEEKKEENRRPTTKLLSNKFLPLTEKVTQTAAPVSVGKPPYVSLETPQHALTRPMTSYSAPPKRYVNHHRDIKGVYDVYPEWWWALDPTNEEIKNSLLMTSQNGRFLVRSAPLDQETLDMIPPATTNSLQKKTAQQLKKKTPNDIPPHRKVQSSRTTLIHQKDASSKNMKKPTSFFISSHLPESSSSQKDINHNDEKNAEEGEEEEKEKNRPLHRKNSTSWTISLDGDLAAVEEPYMIPSPLAPSSTQKAWSKKASVDSVHSTPSTSRMSSRVQLNRRFSPQSKSFLQRQLTSQQQQQQQQQQEEEVDSVERNDDENDVTASSTDLIQAVGSTIQPMDVRSEHDHDHAENDDDEDEEEEEEASQSSSYRERSTPSPVIGGASTMTTASPAYTERTSVLTPSAPAFYRQEKEMTPSRRTDFNKKQIFHQNKKSEEGENADLRDTILHEIPTTATANTMDRRIIDIVDDFLKRDWAFEAKDYAASTQPSSEPSTSSQPI